MVSQLIPHLSPELSPELINGDTPASMAKAAGLRYVSDRQPGYRRRRRGRGFSYYDWQGNPIQDNSLRARFDHLVIPPAWQEV